jgi:hypothetical protein
MFVGWFVLGTTGDQLEVACKNLVLANACVCAFLN